MHLGLFATSTNRYNLFLPLLVQTQRIENKNRPYLSNTWSFFFELSFFGTKGQKKEI